MKYLLMIYLNPTRFAALPQAERDAVMAAHDDFQKSLAGTGELLGFAALAEPPQSSTVRVRDGVPAVTDGPYVEAKEHLAGFYAVECATVERANELAAKIPDARYTAIEVRPLVADSGLGGS